jgi:hypothetical protein
MRRMLAVLAVAVSLACPSALARETFVLHGAAWQVSVDPQTLEVTAEPDGGRPVTVSLGQEDLGRVEALSLTGDKAAAWDLPKAGVHVALSLTDAGLDVRFAADRAGEFTWPVVPGAEPVRAFILPLSEGSYAPADDTEWIDHLCGLGPIDTTSGLSMPFWGVDCGDRTLTWILTNEFTNRLDFRSEGGRLALALTHEFTPAWSRKEYGLLICPGGPSTIEPARQFRRWLEANGGIVTLTQKAAARPAVEKLFGAPQAYLWGDDILSRRDVLDWKGLAGALTAGADAATPSPGRRIWDLLDKDSRDALRSMASGERAYAYAQSALAAAISAALKRKDLYDEAAWKGVDLGDEARRLLAGGVDGLNVTQLRRFNSLLFHAAFGRFMLPVDRWGDGVSVQMIDLLKEDGIRRIWLGLNSWQGGYNHPAAVRAAVDAGYLIGPYDSYDSVHPPDAAETWETAQFGSNFYESGAVIGRDGQPLKGFKRIGHVLSPLVAMPCVKARVEGIMQALPTRYNSWFVDCDAFGQLYDDYSQAHPATQQQDMQARLARMEWIRDTYGLVVGSERGAGYAAPAIDFAHGMTTPVIGWGDPDLQTKKDSPYYLGAWWPPDGPAVFVKQVPLKPAYYRFVFDPRFRLPLYQTALHDSLITTHHWSAGSLKFSDQVVTTELTELLYCLPPLYHLNLDEYAKHRERILSHYAFFEPLGSVSAPLPLTDFRWLTPDRLVQRTVFGGRLEMTANFSGSPWRDGALTVPARSITARWLDTGAVSTYTPAGAGG